MKIYLLILFLFTAFSQAQEVNEVAKRYIKTNKAVYEMFETYASNKWENEKDITIEINKQANAYTQIGLNITKDLKGYGERVNQLLLKHYQGRMDANVNWVFLLNELEKEKEFPSSISQSDWGSGLNANAQRMKGATPEIYEAVKGFAVNKWGSDHQMILFEINQQCDAFNEFIKIMDSKLHSEIVMNAVKKWSNGNDKNILSNPTVDWHMVVFEINQQIKAKNSY